MSLPNTHFGAERIAQIMENAKGVWFLGIGGVSMSALAEYTLALGRRVGGSDRTETARTDRLRSLGALLAAEETGEIPEGYGVVVYTVAVQETHPQYTYARKVGIPCVSRADYLGWLIAGYRRRVGIAGMHGKSTCTAMCAEILMRAENPTVFAGAELPAFGGNTGRVGAAGGTVLFEACEYKDSFLDLCPNIAVVLNIGMDHVDYFHSPEQVRASFRRYADLAAGGTLLWNLDDPESRNAFSERLGAKTFSVSEAGADFRAEHVRTERGSVCFDLREKGREPYPVKARAVGLHNVYNALAAAAAARLAGAEPETVTKALAGYRGVARRMEYRGEMNGSPVYDDYAHHPDEIRATLAGARELVPRGGRLVCVYQPHTYSRTDGLFGSFTTAFRSADAVLFTDIYAARETNESGVTSQLLANAVAAGGTDAFYTGDLSRTAKAVSEYLRPDDLLLIMGAGDVENLFAVLPIQTK